MKSEPENSFESLLSLVNCISKQDKRLVMKKTWSKSLKSIFLAEIKLFFFPTKRKLSILLNSPFLCLLLWLNMYTFNLCYVKKKNPLREMVCIHEKKLTCINYSVNIMTSCTRNLDCAPSSHWVGSTAGALRHPRLETELK